MTESYSSELYRQEGDSFRSVHLSVTADGSVRLDAQDMGKFVEEVWGDRDYEFGVDVPVTALPKVMRPQSGRTCCAILALRASQQGARLPARPGLVGRRDPTHEPLHAVAARRFEGVWD